MTKRIEITDKMAKGFAAEITSKRENLESKKGFHLGNFMINAKFGKIELDGAYEQINVSWEFLNPVKSVVTNKRRSKIYFNENSCCDESAKVLLNEIIKGVEDFEHVLYLCKNEQYYILDECYPAFSNVLQNFSIGDLERRITEFYEYLTNLGGSEVYDAPMLENEDMSEDYFKRREEQRNLAIELAVEDYDMKNYKERENYEEEDLKNYLANMLGRVYAHRCLKDDEEISIGDVVYMVKVFMEKLQELRGADLEYDALVLAKDKDMRVRAEFYEEFETMESEIMIALLNAKIFDAKCVAEGLNRMYWDTIIWENDDVAVKYTSPCEDFERGCLLVVEKESECMLGGWIDVSSNQDAVEHVVEEIERNFWEVRIVTK
jgi:hypothetical protein